MSSSFHWTLKAQCPPFRAERCSPSPPNTAPFSTVAPPFWLTALWLQLGCLSWKETGGKEGESARMQGPREAAHPKGRGAPCPSCLLRHIPGICILTVTPWDIPAPSNCPPTPCPHTHTLVLQGREQGDDMRSVIPHPPRPRASCLQCLIL